MFCVSDAEAAAIRAAFDQEGEMSAAIELRRLFPSITDNVKARSLAQIVSGRNPLPVMPRPRGVVATVARIPSRPASATGRL
jgi:hypothetical protein